ncbi:Uncharacterized protein Adt_33092 [Abeliophyllum distichum]|uniref:Uncharacterized protein n=1 Tax=Abeliophyllum distichum TaxID=126358 RepID=A0ABD1QV91_9LAMI
MCKALAKEIGNKGPGFLAKQGMDNINIFINCNGESTGILVPICCTYTDLIDLIMSVLKLDKRSSALSIQYEVVGCLSSMKITNDNTLMFYLVLKRKDQNITSYPLQIDVTRSLEQIPANYTLDISGDHEMERLE